MKYELEPFHRNLSDKELINDLRSIARKLGKDHVTIDEYNEKGRYHNSTLTRRFGSWFKALEKAGLKKTRNLNISNEELFQNLVEVWTNLGKQPKYDDVNSRLSKYSAGTYEKRFGRWRKALNAFVQWANKGIKPEKSSNQKNKTEKHNTPRTINWRLRALVLMRDGARCQLCGRYRKSNGLYY